MDLTLMADYSKHKRQYLISIWPTGKSKEQCLSVDIWLDRDTLERFVEDIATALEKGATNGHKRTSADC